MTTQTASATTPANASTLREQLLLAITDPWRGSDETRAILQTVDRALRHVAFESGLYDDDRSEQPNPAP